MSRIGIFGGSFDPIHLGHVGVAERAMAEHSLDRVLVVPAAVCPFKTANGPQMDDDLRWRMVVAACEGHPGLEPCDIELRRGGVSYTIDTVRAVAAANPGAELFFIVGEDSVPGLPKWRNWIRRSWRRLSCTIPKTFSEQIFQKISQYPT